MADNEQLNKLGITFLCCTVVLAIFILLFYRTRKKKDNNIYVMKNKDTNKVYKNIDLSDFERKEISYNNMYNNISVEHSI